jgi:hypothetical protein
MPPVKNSKFNPQPGSGLKCALGAVIDEVRPFLDGLLVKLLYTTTMPTWRLLLFHNA